jgi:hypothetical protein
MRHPFSPPWSIDELEACFVVRDHNGSNSPMSISMTGQPHEKPLKT